MKTKVMGSWLGAALAATLLLPLAAAARVTITLEPGTLTVGPGEAQDILVRIRGTRDKRVRVAVCNGDGLECMADGSNFLGTVEVVGHDEKRNPIVRYTAPVDLPSTPPCTDLLNGCQLQIRVRLVGTRRKKFAVVAIPAAQGPTDAGVLEAVSVHTDGTPANSTSYSSSVSADGRFVAFQSEASNLVDDDTNGSDDVFLRDTCLGVANGCVPSTQRVSLDSSNFQFLDSSVPALNADGRFVAFTSTFVESDCDPDLGLCDSVMYFNRVFVRDTCLGAADCTPSTSQVSATGFWPLLNADGRFVAFNSNDNGRQDAFLGDLCLGAQSCTPSTLLISDPSESLTADGRSRADGVSANGRFVAFTFCDNNAPQDGSKDPCDGFVRDTCVTESICAPSTELVSVAGDGSAAGASGGPMSSDGRFVVFTSAASNVLDGDTNGAHDIFLRDTCRGVLDCTPSTIRLSVSLVGFQGDRSSFDPSISADGRYVAFDSDATNLVAGDTNGARDVFVHDTCRGAPEGCVPTTVRVSVAGDGAQANGDSFGPRLSADGRFVVFVSAALNLMPDDTTPVLKVFLARTGY